MSPIPSEAPFCHEYVPSPFEHLSMDGTRPIKPRLVLGPDMHSAPGMVYESSGAPGHVSSPSNYEYGYEFESWRDSRAYASKEPVKHYHVRYKPTCLCPADFSTAKMRGFDVENLEKAADAMGREFDIRASNEYGFFIRMGPSVFFSLPPAEKHKAKRARGWEVAEEFQNHLVTSQKRWGDHPDMTFGRYPRQFRLNILDLSVPVVDNVGGSYFFEVLAMQVGNFAKGPHRQFPLKLPPSPKVADIWIGARFGRRAYPMMDKQIKRLVANGEINEPNLRDIIDPYYRIQFHD